MAGSQIQPAGYRLASTYTPASVHTRNRSPHRPRRRLGKRLGVAALLCGLGLVAASPAGAAGPRIPAKFFGVASAGPLETESIDVNAQLAKMRSVGTGSIRFPVYWSLAEPYRSMNDVPADQRSSFTSVGGRPIAFAGIDKQILAYASHGLQMLPDVLQAPAWARLKRDLLWSPPAHPSDYAAFVGALVSRYGPRGTFWAAHPSLAGRAPRSWQIWNEPAGGAAPEGSSTFWNGPHPYEPRYISMLRLSRRAARAADPHASIVLGGLFGRSWDALTGIYHYGGRGLFDQVAIHPYANTAAHVLAILQNVHTVLVRNHASRVPVLVTETGWTSSQHHIPTDQPGIETTEARQASNLAAEYPLLAAHRRELNLQGVYWYTWIGTEPSTYPFDYSGLLSVSPSGRIHEKPAFRAYRHALGVLEH